MSNWRRLLISKTTRFQDLRLIHAIVSSKDNHGIVFTAKYPYLNRWTWE